jgi:lipopolysaccharide exporter
MEQTGPDSKVDAVPVGRRAPNLTTQTASGLRWSLLGTAALMLANLVYTATISRLLDPVAFGLMALANLAVLFTQFFARMGIASALVQKPDLSEDDVRAASTAGIVGGVACFAVIWVLAPPVSAAFHQPPLTPMLRVLGIGFIFDGWSMTGTGLLLRELRFRERSIVNLGTYVLGFLVVGVGAALLGAGTWSLVAASVVSTVAQAVWLYALLRFPVRPVLRWEPYRAVCGYGARLLGTHVMDYVSGNLDTLTVGRYASAAALGQYSRAYYLGFQPLGYHLAQASTNVLFSGLSRIQEDLDRLRRAFLGAFALSCVVLFPICVGLAVAAAEVVPVVLGPQWTLAVTLLPWFAVASGFSVLSKLSRSMVEARAELNGSLIVQAVHLVALGTALLVLALTLRSWGVWIFAAAVAGGEVLRHLGYLALVRRILKLSAVQVGQLYAPAAFASLCVALAIVAIRTVAPGRLPVVVLLGAEIVAGAAALMLCIRYCLPHTRRELRMRLTAAGVLGEVGGLRERLGSILLGPPDPAMTRELRP